MAAWMLHGACVGEDAGARSIVFFRVKWLQPAIKGSSCVQRVWLHSFWSDWFLQGVFATCGVWCVRSCRVFCNLRWQIATQWLHACCHHCCHVRRYMRACHRAVQIALQWMHQGSSLLRLCASYYGILQLGIVNRIGVVASRLRYWFVRRIFSILALVIFLFEFLPKSASKSVFRLGTGIRFWSYNFCCRCS